MKGHKPYSLEDIHYYDGRKCCFIHYTCNSPPSNVLEKEGIRAIGNYYGCADPREVLEIPVEVYLRGGFQFTQNPNAISLNIETLLRVLGEGRLAA